MKPKVSIIIPVYGVEKYIDRCLKSIVNQTLQDIEILIINDGTKDNSMAIVENYSKNDKRIRVYNKINEGLGLTRNYGLKKAKGEYVCFVDSDDYLANDMCQTLYEVACKENADIVYGDIYKDYDGNIETEKMCFDSKQIWEDSRVKELILDFVGTMPNNKKDTIMEVSVWKALFRKKVLDKNKIEFISERILISEDLIFDIDIFQKVKKVVYIPKRVYYYCYNNVSLSKIYRNDRYDKVLILYHELNKRLKIIFNNSYNYILRTDRFLISSTRVNLRQNVNAAKKIGYEKCMHNIEKICNTKEIVEVLNRYPIHKLPLKYMITSYMIKFKMYKLIYKTFGKK